MDAKKTDKTADADADADVAADAAGSSDRALKNQKNRLPRFSFRATSPLPPKKIVADLILIHLNFSLYDRSIDTYPCQLVLSRLQSFHRSELFSIEYWVKV